MRVRLAGYKDAIQVGRYKQYLRCGASANRRRNLRTFRKTLVLKQVNLNCVLRLYPLRIIFDNAQLIEKGNCLTAINL